MRITLLSFTLFFILALKPSAAGSGSVTAAEASSFRKQHESEWLAALPHEGSRLFYSDRDWPGLRKSFGEFAQGRVSAERDAFWKQARQIAAEPPPAYATPEEKATGKTTLFDARQELWERAVGDDLVTLALAAKLSDDPVFSKRLTENVLAACQFPTWGKYGPNMDLAAGHVLRGIAIAYDWHRNLFTAEEKDLIFRTVESRAAMLFTGVCGEAYWASRFTENHNQINSAGLGLAGLAFLGDMPAAGDWLSAAMIDFDNVAKTANADGSSSEGVPYWSYGVSFILQFIEGTKLVTGSARLYDSPFLRHAAAYRTGLATPGLDGVVAWGDSTTQDFYGPQQILYRLASEYKDPAPYKLATELPFKPKGGSDVLVWSMLWKPEALPAGGQPPLDYHAGDWDVVTSRSGWKNDDYLLAIKSGFTNRNHSHLDAGALALSIGDSWVLVTPGYGRGSGEAGFWDGKEGRWKYFSNSTESHSTLLVDGKNQKFSPESRATITDFLSSPEECWTTVDLHALYDGVDSAERTVYHRRRDYILVLDSVRASHPVTVDWLAQATARSIVKEGRLQSWASGGHLELKALHPDTPFSPRMPNSPKVDVPAENLRTFSLQQSGTAAGFAVLMQPIRRGDAVPSLETAYHNENGSQTVTVTGTNFRDSIAAGSESLRLDAGDRYGATGRKIAIREQEGKLVSVSGVSVEEIRLAGAALTFHSPAAISAEELPGGEWELTLASSASPKIQLNGGWTLRNAGQPLQGGDAVDLAPGCYRLSPPLISPAQ